MFHIGGVLKKPVERGLKHRSAALRVTTNNKCKCFHQVGTVTGFPVEIDPELNEKVTLEYCETLGYPRYI